MHKEDQNAHYRITEVTFGPELSKNIDRLFAGRNASEQRAIREALDIALKDATTPSKNYALTKIKGPFKLTLDSADGNIFVQLDNKMGESLKAFLPMRRLEVDMLNFWDNLAPYMKRALPTGDMRQILEEARHDSHGRGAELVRSALAEQGMPTVREYGGALFEALSFAYHDKERINPRPQVAIRMAQLDARGQRVAF